MLTISSMIFFSALLLINFGSAAHSRLFSFLLFISSASLSSAVHSQFFSVSQFLLFIFALVEFSHSHFNSTLQSLFHLLILLTVTIRVLIISSSTHSTVTDHFLSPVSSKFHHETVKKIVLLYLTITTP